MALLELKNKNTLEGIHQPRTWGFTPSKLSGIILKQISAYSSAHQAFLNRLWCLRTSSSHSLAPLVTLSEPIQQLLFPHESLCAAYTSALLPKNICVYCKNACYQRPFFQIKLQASKPLCAPDLNNLIRTFTK